MKTYLIWSEEHRRWWGPGGFAYCDSVYSAGRYSEAEAFEICDTANRYLRAGEPLHEFPVPDPCAPPTPPRLRYGRMPPGTFILSPQRPEDGGSD